MDENGDEATQEIHFFYDAQSKPTFVEYGGTMYRYVHNLQGDIVAIVDSTGNTVVEYKYDAWGKELNEPSEIDVLNPYRYRCNVYDLESGLLYLRGRYYNVAQGRFVNADAMLNRSCGYNQYAYCKNNPVMLTDRSGYAPKLFYFYGGDQQGHAEANIEDLKDDFDVHGYLITSPDSFVDSWEDMYENASDEDEIDIVIINVHGSPYYVQYMDYIDKLDFSKRIDTLILLSCNCGHQSCAEQNAVQRIIAWSGNNIRQFIAADGTHRRGALFNSRAISVKADAEWRKSRVDKKKKSMGFVRYLLNDSGSYVISSIGKKFKSVKALLQKVGWI